MVINDKNLEETESELEYEVKPAIELEKDMHDMSVQIPVGIRIVQDSDVEENA
ncbi:MAG: hypothetical protein U1E78_05515 [Gammaproteobacteria bacterium]